MYYQELHEQAIAFNDHELLYLMAEGSDEARDIMFEKYKFLIKTKIKKFNVDSSNRDDYFQEGLLTLHKAIRLYRTDSKMSFTKYFDLLLQRHYIDLYRIHSRYQNRYYLKESIDYVIFDYPAEKIYEDTNYDFGVLSMLEKEIFELKFQKHYRSSEIANILNIEVKQVYNACERIRKKLKRQRNLN